MFLIFGKFGVLYFLVTPVLRFALLPYYQRYLYEYHLHQLTSSSSNESWKLRSSLSPKSVQINQWYKKKVIPGYSIIHIRNIFFTSMISETPCKAGRICKNKYYLFVEYIYFYMLPGRNRTIIRAGNNMFKVNTKKRCEKCSKLTIKTPEQRHWDRFGVFIVNFEPIPHLVPVFLLLTLSK